MSTLSQKSDARAEHATFVPPYAPSWFDHLKHWVERRPGPYWLYYVLIGALMLVIRTATEWQSAPQNFGKLSAATMVFAAGVTFILGYLHYLDRVAADVLRRARPALNIDEKQYAQLEYRLTTLPALVTLAVSVFAGIAGPLAFGITSRFYADFFLFATPFAEGVNWALDFLSWACGGLFAIHTVHQLREVNAMYQQYAVVNLFQRGPLFVFSRLTARAAIALPVINVSWWLIEPRFLAEPLSLTIGIAAFLLGAATFFLPLIGIHNRIAAEKEKTLDAVGSRIQTLTHEAHQALDRRAFPELDAMKKGLDTLETEQRLVERIPTWPWAPETFRLLISALLFPIVLFAIQFVIQRMLAP